MVLSFLGVGVEIFPSTPCSQVVSNFAVAHVVSAYKLLYFTVYLELFPFRALRPDTVAFVRMLTRTHARAHTHTRTYTLLSWLKGQLDACCDCFMVYISTYETKPSGATCQRVKTLRCGWQEARLCLRQ